MRVLLVDDEPELVFTMAERLELRGYEVDAVTGGEAALEKIRSVIYDVAVVDLKMPGMSGAVLLETVRQENPRLPIILLTGHGATSETEETLEDLEGKACAYVFKPVNIDELIGIMESCAKD